MLFDILTLFPDLFESFWRESLIGKALDKGVFEVRTVNIRDFATDRHRTVDDRPFGGGPGMILMPEPLHEAIKHARESGPTGPKTRVVLLSPAGSPFNQAKAGEYAGLDHLVLVCGRYEGVDERIISTLIDEELSIGDFILSGGEVPAMVVIEAVARLLPGVLGALDSAVQESFSEGLLEYPQYTRPREFKGLSVPDVLLSGDHERISQWRRRESLKRTARRRPDLLAKVRLSVSDQEFLADAAGDEGNEQNEDQESGDA